jgi:glutamine cyclotransferase
MGQMKSVINLSSLTVLPLILILSLSCCRKNAPQKLTAPAPQDQQTVTQLISPKQNAIIKWGDSVKIELTQINNEFSIDSMTITSEKKPGITVPGNSGNTYWQTTGSRVGQNTLSVMVYYADSMREAHNVNIVILSDISPVNYTYRVINKFPHDDKAYTQGLVYDEGILYESTGLEGKSSLRTVNIITGQPEKVVALAPQYFGEGIALFKDQIYQITYKSQLGFVYDKKTLNQIRSFDYQIREGWGLTTDGKVLIMSDGSDHLFYIEPEFFSQVDMIEVFDNKGMVDSLNEIEYINGKILANIYGQTYIVIIDPSTGKVTGKVELRDIMPKGSIGDYGKVLNGIAYNSLTKHLYITGKNWPVLYEIELMPSL